MSGVATPPPTTSTATVSSGPRESASLGQARIIAMPERPTAEAQAGRGLTLTGTVVSQDKDGTATIRTAAGDVTVKTDTKLPTDKPITLQIPPSQGKSAGLLLANLSSLLPSAPEAGPGKPSSPLVQPATTTPQNTAPQNTAPQTPGNTAGGVLSQAAPSLPNIAVRPGVILQATVASNTPAAPAPTATLSPTQPTTLPQTATTPAAPMPAQAAAAPVAAAPAAPAAPGTAPGGAATASAPPSPTGTAPALPTAAAPTAPSAPPVAAPAPAPLPTSSPSAPPPSTPSPAPTAAGAAPAAAPQPAGQAAASSLPTASPAGASATPTTTPAASLPATGSALPVRVLMVTPPGTAPQPLPPIPPGFAVLSGTVESTLSTGQPVLVSNQGVLVLNTRAALPPGTGVTIAMTADAAAKPGGPASTSTAPLPLPPTSLATAALTSPKGIDWPALSRGFEMLAATNPAAADALRDTAMPRPNARLGSAMLGMMAALKRGDVGSWLGGAAMEVIARQGAGVARQLAADFASLRHTARDVGGDEWRGYTLPMEMPGGAITPVQLHIRAQPQDDAAEDDTANRRDGGVRFLIDLHLTQLGPMQIEGLARSQDHRLDMIIRTREALPAELRGELQQLYNAALQATAQAGGLIFQRGEQGWLRLARQRAGDPLGLQA